MSYTPVWKRAPNKFLRYESRAFTLPSNAHDIVKSGVETIAIFKDKHNKKQEMQAFIKWNEND